MRPPTGTPTRSIDDLPPDLVAWIGRNFSSADQAEAIARLLSSVIETGEAPSDRLLRCAAMASRGELDKLDYYVRLLAIDWRDVIVAGEYVPSKSEPSKWSLVRVRDLNGPIVDDLPVGHA